MTEDDKSFIKCLTQRKEMKNNRSKFLECANQKCLLRTHENSFLRANSVFHVEELIRDKKLKIINICEKLECEIELDVQRDVAHRIDLMWLFLTLRLYIMFSAQIHTYTIHFNSTTKAHTQNKQTNGKMCTVNRLKLFNSSLT